MILKNTVLRGYFLTAFILSFVSIATILIIRSFLPPVVPLFYGKPVGSDQLAPNLYLLVVPFASLLISTTNVFVSNSVTDEFTKRVLAISSFIVSFMATVTIVKIILLVGFF